MYDLASNYCGDGRNDEVKGVMCGRREEGRTSSMASEVCMDKAYVKAKLPDRLDQQKRKPKNEWTLMVFAC